MTSVERGLREASGDRHPYSRTAVAGMWMFCKRLSCRHCEEAGFLICSEGASGEAYLSRICLNEYTSVFRQAGRLIFCSTFACLPLREFSHGFKSFRFCYEQRNARVIPLRKEGQSSAFFSRGCPIHLPPVTGYPHALRRHSSFRQSCAPPSTIGRAACS